MDSSNPAGAEPALGSESVRRLRGGFNLLARSSAHRHPRRRILVGVGGQGGSERGLDTPTSVAQGGRS